MAKRNAEPESRSKVAEVLGQANAVDLILLMSERGEIKTSDVREVPGGYYRLKDVLDKLVSSGIVERKPVEKPYMTYFYKLTDIGKQVADKLVEIDEILS